MALDQRYLDKLKAEYLRRDRETKTGGSETQSEWNPVAAEEQWNALSEQDKVSLGNGYMPVKLDDDDPDVAAFKAKFGEGKFDPAEVNNQQLSGYQTGYGIPQYGKHGLEDFAQDPSRVLWLDGPEVPIEKRRWIMEAGNIKGDTIAQAQAEGDDGLSDVGWALSALALFGGAVALAGTAGAAGTAAGAAEGAAGGAAGTAAAGATDAAAAELLATGGGAGAGLTPASYAGLGGEFASEGILAGSTAVPEIATSGLIPETAAGTVEGLVAAPEVAGANTGWWANLSPASRSLLTRAGLQAAGTGASALISANAQRNASEDRKEIEDQRRQDTIRRHAVAPRGNTYTARPLPGGLIASRRGGG